MRVALAQIDTTVGAVRANEARIRAAIDEARRGGAELVVFPECAVTGYPPRDLLYSEELVREAARATARIARASADLTVILGTVEPGSSAPGGRPLRRNVAAVLEGGAVRATQAKTLLPAYGVFLEPRWFEPAASNAPLELLGVTSGILVCEDLWDEDYPVHPGPELVRAGARRIFSIHASPYRVGIGEERLRRARRLGVPLVYVNAVGGEDELVFDGGSFVLSGSGEVTASLPRFEEAVTVVDLDLGGEVAPPLEREDELFRALTLGIRDFVRKNGVREVVLGLSGGVDSALVACLAREALGKERVHAVLIPSRFTDPRSTEDARALARALGIGFEVVPLEPLHRAAESCLDLAGGTTAENVQARLRMLVLMARVNRRGGLLLNTSNKTELALGYGTLYGDLAGGLAPIADLTKPEVYALARFHDRSRGVIPPFVLERPPSAELAPGQVDPFDYPRVAPLVEALVEGESTDALVRLGASRDEALELERRVREAEHKRRQGTIGLKVARTSFGSGRIVPVTQGWSVPARSWAGAPGPVSVPS